MSDHEPISQIPPRHQEMMNMFLAGKVPEGLVDVFEGKYLPIPNEGYAGNFISCPAILIEGPDNSLKCLHVTYEEFVDAAVKGTFEESPVDFQELKNDLAAAKKITALLTATESSGESRAEELKKVGEILHYLSGKQDFPINLVPVAKDQFHLLITPDTVSVWHGKDFVGMV